MSPDAAATRLLVADTHLPRRARDRPAQLWDAIEAADAGDWVDEAALDALLPRATGRTSPAPPATR